MVKFFLDRAGVRMNMSDRSGYVVSDTSIRNNNDYISTWWCIKNDVNEFVKVNSFVFAVCLMKGKGNEGESCWYVYFQQEIW